MSSSYVLFSAVYRSSSSAGFGRASSPGRSSPGSRSPSWVRGLFFIGSSGFSLSLPLVFCRRRECTGGRGPCHWTHSGSGAGRAISFVAAIEGSYSESLSMVSNSSSRGTGFDVMSKNHLLGVLSKKIPVCTKSSIQPVKVICSSSETRLILSGDALTSLPWYASQSVACWSSITTRAGPCQ